jgi:triosephosphate isomerase
MRKNIVAGNWKMHKTQKETVALLEEISTKKTNTNAELIVAPTFVNLAKAVEITQGKGITVAAQNMHQAEGGAFTGEIAAGMLTDIGVKTVILGHSERRAYFHETDALLANKVDTALQHDMRVIFCFGEELKDRQNDNHFNIVENQLRDGLFHIEKKDWANIVLAYEPVWAIGTGEVASPEQAQEMHARIRAWLRERFDAETASIMALLYGGSVKPDNAAALFGQKDINGGLIGGASLKANDFLALLDALRSA